MKGERSRLVDRPAFRAGLVLTVVVVAFLVVRQLAVPASFGEFGYYRGDNVREQVALAANFSRGAEVCQSCHADQYQQWKQAQHAGVNCESCHGPASAHVADFQKVKPERPRGREFCASCHDRLAARPEAIRQVDVTRHNTGVECIACHNPHQPRP